MHSPTRSVPVGPGVGDRGLGAWASRPIREAPGPSPMILADSWIVSARVLSSDQFHVLLRCQRVDRSAMLDECPMTEDCPGYARDRRLCLLRPDDCEFSPADGEAALAFETSEALMHDAST